VIELPDNIPEDLDYSRYIEESEKLLKSVGLSANAPTYHETKGDL
jgi:hypothetical protein